ncbi:unnamed protein product [Laminaria digitata]
MIWETLRDRRRVRAVRRPGRAVVVVFFVTFVFAARFPRSFFVLSRRSPPPSRLFFAFLVSPPPPRDRFLPSAGCLFLSSKRPRGYHLCLFVRYLYVQVAPFAVAVVGDDGKGVEASVSRTRTYSTSCYSGVYRVGTSLW